MPRQSATRPRRALAHSTQRHRLQETVNIVVSAEQELVHKTWFHFPRRARLSGLMARYCTLHGMNAATAFFYHKENRIHGTDTPHSLRMSRDDSIEVEVHDETGSEDEVEPETVEDEVEDQNENEEGEEEAEDEEHQAEGTMEEAMEEINEEVMEELMEEILGKAREEEGVEAEPDPEPEAETVPARTTFDECPICFYDYRHDQRTWDCEACKNRFHAHCIEAWAQSRTDHVTCPYCRAEMW